METNAKPKKWRKRNAAVLVAVLGVVGLWLYVKTNPTVFNESFLGHAHCIRMAEGALEHYAVENGSWPYHTNGFGDAILLTIEDFWPCFTGPGFDESELQEAFRSKRDVDESKLGRIYVQERRFFSQMRGTNRIGSICYLFDQVATPGDHMHGPSRLWAPKIREVLEDGEGFRLIRDDEWYAYATNQIELLVAEGIDRKTAQHYYEMTGLKFEK